MGGNTTGTNIEGRYVLDGSKKEEHHQSFELHHHDGNDPRQTRFLTFDDRLVSKSSFNTYTIGCGLDESVHLDVGSAYYYGSSDSKGRCKICRCSLRIICQVGGDGEMYLANEVNCILEMTAAIR
jgi:hypothetical protein